jgi:hypothetical protein
MSSVPRSRCARACTAPSSGPSRWTSSCSGLAVHEPMELGRVDRLVGPARGRAPERELGVVVVHRDVDAQLHDPAAVPVRQRRGPRSVVRPPLVTQAERQPGRRAHDLPPVTRRAARRSELLEPSRLPVHVAKQVEVHARRAADALDVQVGRPVRGHERGEFLMSRPQMTHRPARHPDQNAWADATCSAGTSTKACIHRIGRGTTPRISCPGPAAG